MSPHSCSLTSGNWRDPSLDGRLPPEMGKHGGRELGGEGGAEAGHQGAAGSPPASPTCTAPPPPPWPWLAKTLLLKIPASSCSTDPMRGPQVGRGEMPRQADP